MEAPTPIPTESEPSSQETGPKVEVSPQEITAEKSSVSDPYIKPYNETYGWRGSAYKGMIF